MSVRRKPPRSMVERGAAKLEQLGFTVVVGAYACLPGAMPNARRTCWRCWSVTLWTP
jgi:hypothetical protein